MTEVDVINYSTEYSYNTLGASASLKRKGSPFEDGSIVNFRTEVWDWPFYVAKGYLGDGGSRCLSGF